jgi:hypothetical protein
MRGQSKIALCTLFFLAVTVPAFSESDNLKFAQVIRVTATRTGSTWTFSVTVRHADEGWNHYADQWQVVDPESGEVLATRVLAHPHVDEQPFTRSLSNIAIPEGVAAVLVRAKCNLHGFEGRTVLVDLTVDSGPGFTVK